MCAQALERHGIDLTWSPKVLDVLADGYNISYGARSLKYEASICVATPITFSLYIYKCN